MEFVDDSSIENRRSCWICFGCDEDDPTAKWLRPCKCRGTSMWVHNMCLQRWFDEKQQGNPTVHVFCPQCNAEYKIDYPALGPLLVVIGDADNVVYKMCHYLAAGSVIACIYWSAVSFGAITVMQVMGHKHGFEIMENADPIFLLLGLPTIPFGLILAKMIRWEDYALRFWRKHSKKWWIIKKLFGSDSSEEERPVREPRDTNTQTDLSTAPRVLCGALTLPTIATAFGNYFYGNVESPLRRALLGGSTFILAKGFVQIYYRHQQYLRLARRTIRNYTEESASTAL